MPTFGGLGFGGGGFKFATVGATTGSPSTGTFTDSSNFLWSFYRYTGSGSMNILSEGFIDLLVVGGGGGGNQGQHPAGGGGGAVRWGIFWVTAGPYTITVGGSAAAANNGNTSSFGTTLLSGGGSRGQGSGSTWDNNAAYAQHGGGGSGGAVTGPVFGGLRGAGQGGNVYGSDLAHGISLNYANSAVTYSAGGTGGAGAANTGNGGFGNNSGGSGIIIARVRLS